MDKEALQKTVAEFNGVFKDIAADAIRRYLEHANKHPLPFCGVTQDELDAGDKIRDEVHATQNPLSGHCNCSGIYVLPAPVHCPKCRKLIARQQSSKTTDK